MSRKPRPGQPWDRKERPFRRVVILEVVANKVTYQSSTKPNDVLTVELELFRTMYRKGSWTEIQTRKAREQRRHGLAQIRQEQSAGVVDGTVYCTCKTTQGRKYCPIHKLER